MYVLDAGASGAHYVGWPTPSVEVSQLTMPAEGLADIVGEGGENRPHR